MNPVFLTTQVTEALRNLVRGSFPISTPTFEGMVEDFLYEPKNFIQGPWISVDLPFKSVEAERAEFFPQIPMGFAPYAHQWRAFERLSGDDLKSTLVATGTGSGKTECFEMPILEHCRAHKGEPGIKAIIIYPMNALATDQAKRIAKKINQHASLHGVRCGIYADAQPISPTAQMTEKNVITSRDEMRRNPPDILLTNYKMLDYLLLRSQDKDLWAKNTAETLRYLVVDELHSFDGAQGADLALLVRRLKSRLGCPENHLVCVGTSATLGSGERVEEDLVKYASDLFGERFEDNPIIRETRSDLKSFFGDPQFLDLPNARELQKLFLAADDLSQAQAADQLARLFFEDAYDEIFQGLGGSETDAWRKRLGVELRQHLAFQELVRALSSKKGPMSVQEVVDLLQANRRYRKLDIRYVDLVVSGLIALLSWAKDEDSGRALLNVRIQFWAREMARMVANLPGGFGGQKIDLLHSGDLSDDDAKRCLPVIHCSNCGTAGYVTAQKDAGNAYEADLNAIYRAYFDGSKQLRLLFLDRFSADLKGLGVKGMVQGYVNPQNLEWSVEPSTDPDHPTLAISVLDPHADEKTSNVDCPACGTSHSMQILGMRSQRLTAALTTTLFNSRHHEQQAESKPRVLMFSDNVQDAAQRAAVSEIRNTQVVFRKALLQSLELSDLSLDQVTRELPKRLRAELGDALFASRFVPLDFTWRDDYTDLISKGRVGPKFVDDIETRLAWEFFSDLTYRSHTSLTLETMGAAAIEADSVPLQLAAEEFQRKAQAILRDGSQLDVTLSQQILFAVIDEMRRLGAVSVDYVQMALEAGDDRYGLNYFAAQSGLKIGNRSVLPIPRYKRSAAPRPITLRTKAPGFINARSKASSNPIKSILARSFDDFEVSNLGELTEVLFQTMEHQGLVSLFYSKKDDAIWGWLLNPEHLVVSSKTQRLVCSSCDLQETSQTETVIGQRRCRRQGCDGSLVRTQRTDGGAMLALFKTERNHRVVAREHTGMLDSDDRRELEVAFIESENPWAPNLISATPTLEMGIDIGDLSTLILSTVPPEAANYVQRVGRTGRRDGNSLNVTLAAARPHDLQFWEEPSAMLGGEVPAPGVQLSAVAILRRQLAAYSLDCLIASTATEVKYGKVKASLQARDTQNADSFLNRWIGYLEEWGSAIANEFMASLPKDVADQKVVSAGLQYWLVAQDQTGLAWQVSKVFEDARLEKQRLDEERTNIDNEIKRLKRLSPPPKDLDDMIVALRLERTEISRAIKERIDDVDTLRFLTDRGVLPNYAFPEEGVRLKSVLTRRVPQEGGAGLGKNDGLTLREYVRPAASAITELAPFQIFYAEGREVEVNRIDLDATSISNWRFCPNCSHTLEERDAAPGACPKCEEPMYEDKGSTMPLLEMRTVVATRKEKDASIKDSDERYTRRYERLLFPYYHDSSVEIAYGTRKGSETAFGFEFINSCELRDVNFGEQMDAPGPRQVAGNKLKSNPFLICGECGRLQRRKPKDLEPGTDHSLACRAIKEKLEPEEWLQEIVLMRRLQTEALRIIVPVTGKATKDEIKSFVAAFDAGMRRYFQGKIDHLRSAIVEEKVAGVVPVRALYIYDSVPGGSGYLRQIAENPNSLRSVFLLARDLLQNCPCGSEPENSAEGPTKDGCYRCVKSYRSLFGPGTPSRSLALSQFERIIAAWEQLTKSERPINQTLKESLVTSALEERFVDKLQSSFGSDCLKPKVSKSGRSWQISVPANGKTIFWDLEPQVQIDSRVQGAPKRRVDYLLTPMHENGGLPIVIELDGWEYHRESIAKDLEDRMLMRRTGKLRVITLTWDDLSNELTTNLVYPLTLSKMGTRVENTIGGFVANAAKVGFEDLLHGMDQIFNRLGDPSSWVLLENHLKGEGISADALMMSVFLAAKANQTEKPVASSSSGLDERFKDFISEAGLHTHFADGNLAVHLGASECQIRDVTIHPHHYRAIIAIPTELSSLGSEALQISTWRGMWRLFNCLQDIRGFVVAYPGLEDIDFPLMVEESQAQFETAWAEIEDLVDGRARRILLALRADGIEPPDAIGEEIMVGDSVAEMIEIGWQKYGIGFAYGEFDDSKWLLRTLNYEDESDVSDDVAFVLGHINGTVEK